MFWVQDLINFVEWGRPAFWYKFHKGRCFVIIYYLSKHVNNNQVMRKIGTNYYLTVIYARIDGVTLDDEP